MYIETDRLIIRDFELKDAEDLQEILGDEETMKYCEPAYTIEQTKDFLKGFCIAKKGAVAAVLKGSGKVIGYILFKELEKDVYEIGWFFNRSFWGKGYAFEACSKVIEYAFKELNAHKITAETIDGHKSVNMMKKLGMVSEGMQRSHTKDNSGNWADFYLYGFLREDWRRNFMDTKKLIIRNETKKDYRTVEEITRESFWNVYAPGCDEHYLVHILRGHSDFIPELDFVAEYEGRIVGNIMYTKSRLVDEEGNEKRILSFGPICVLPEFQRCGIGKELMKASFEKALELGFDVIVIHGNPGNYMSSGFKSCKKYNVAAEGDVFRVAMLVKELKEGALDGRRWYFYDSPAYEFDAKDAEEFDKSFEPKEKGFKPSQEEFYIYSRSVVKY